MKDNALPIFEKVEHDDSNNYRLVSLIFALAKTMAGVTRDLINKGLKDDNIVACSECAAMRIYFVELMEYLFFYEMNV